MRPILFAVALISTIAGVAKAQTAPPLTVDKARAVIAPFYDALNAAPDKDVVALITRATSDDWVSCSDNENCRPRDKVIPGIVGFHQAIPDLKWEIKEMLVSGNRAIVRGEASGTPSGVFMGVPQAGKSFKVMSIDMHTIEGDRIVRSYHVEDWTGAIRQLSAK